MRHLSRMSKEWSIGSNRVVTLKILLVKCSKLCWKVFDGYDLARNWGIGNSFKIYEFVLKSARKLCWQAKDRKWKRKSESGVLCFSMFCNAWVLIYDLSSMLLKYAQVRPTCVNVSIILPLDVWFAEFRCSRQLNSLDWRQQLPTLPGRSCRPIGMLSLGQSESFQDVPPAQSLAVTLQMARPRPKVAVWSSGSANSDVIIPRRVEFLRTGSTVRITEGDGTPSSCRE